MSSPLPELIVLAAGGSVAPPLLLLAILLLGSRRPLPNATALALGYFVTCGAIGIAGLAFFEASAETGSAVSAVGRVMGAAVGGLLIVLGLRSLLKVPGQETRMVARIAGTMIVSVAVLVTVSLLVSFGVLWWTGSLVTSASIGGVCGLAVAFAVEALTTAVRRAGERPCERLSDVNERSGGGPDRQGK